MEAQQRELEEAGVALLPPVKRDPPSRRRKLPVSPEAAASARLDSTLRALAGVQSSDAVGFLARVVVASESTVVGYDRNGKVIIGLPPLAQRIKAAEILAKWAGVDKPIEAERLPMDRERDREELVTMVLEQMARLAEITRRELPLQDLEYQEVGALSSEVEGPSPDESVPASPLDSSDDESTG